MADLLLTNGRIHTLSGTLPPASSLAVEGGKVVSVGEKTEANRVIDLGGRTVVPGFIDAHAHMGMYGQTLRELDLGGARTMDEIISRVQEKARPGSWVRGRNWQLDESPNHRRLSEATPETPVWLWRRDTHSGLANARAMEAAGVTRDTPDPARGRIGRDADGEPDGLFYETATDLIENVLPTASLHECFLAAQKEALQMGVVGVHDASVNDEYLRLLMTLEQSHLLRLRVHALYYHKEPDRIVDFMNSTRPRTGRLNIRGIKLFMDGALGSRTAWMLEPFCNDPENLGMSRLSREELEKIGTAAKDRGFQVCTHAIGDRANREVLDAYEAVAPGGDHRWRIEHAQHVAVEDFHRFDPWIASIQPSHCVADRELVEKNLPDRVPGAYSWKTMKNLALGTDAPVDSLDPRWTFHCAVSRGGWRPEECLTPEQALRGMTVDAARAGFMEGGVLAPGRPADLVVLSEDWLAHPEKARESEVLMTMMDGKVAYQSKDFRK